jgi:hypothetical protein
MKKSHARKVLRTASAEFIRLDKEASASNSSKLYALQCRVDIRRLLNSKKVVKAYRKVGWECVPKRTRRKAGKALKRAWRALGGPPRMMEAVVNDEWSQIYTQELSEVYEY